MTELTIVVMEQTNTLLFVVGFLNIHFYLSSPTIFHFQKLSFEPNFWSESLVFIAQSNYYYSFSSSRIIHDDCSPQGAGVDTVCAHSPKSFPTELKV